MSNIILVSATPLEHGGIEEIDGIPIYQVGIGKTESAVNTTKLILEKQPELLINFGSCGSLKNHKTGELLEVGVVYNDFYANTLHSSLPFKLSTSGVKCFTTDTFYSNEENYHHSYEFRSKYCDIVDMELYGIAYASRVCKVGLKAYKWISDDGNSNDWEKFAKIGFEKFRQQLKSILSDHGSTNR